MILQVMTLSWNMPKLLSVKHGCGHACHLPSWKEVMLSTCDTYKISA